MGVVAGAVVLCQLVRAQPLPSNCPAAAGATVGVTAVAIAVAPAIEVIGTTARGAKGRVIFMDSFNTKEPAEFASAQSRIRPTRPGRDRRNRGIRGTLAPTSIPLTASRAELFDSVVLTAIERIQTTFPELLEIDIQVEDVPPGARRDGSADPIPLGRIERPNGDHFGSLIIYRFPIEHRTRPGAEREQLVSGICTELAAELLGIAPIEVDPNYDTGR